MIVIHDPEAWAKHLLTQAQSRLRNIEKRPVGRSAAEGEWPSQRLKDQERNITLGRITILKELVDGLENAAIPL